MASFGRKYPNLIHLGMASMPPNPTDFSVSSTVVSDRQVDRSVNRRFGGKEKKLFSNSIQAKVINNLYLIEFFCITISSFEISFHFSFTVEPLKTDTQMRRTLLYKTDIKSWSLPLFQSFTSLRREISLQKMLLKRLLQSDSASDRQHQP